MLEIVGAHSADFFGIHYVTLIGDGSSTSITINLTQGPFAVNFAGNNPHTLRSFVALPSVSGVTATATLAGTSLKITLSAALPLNEILVVLEANWSFT